MPIIKRSVRTGVFDGCESIQDKAAKLKQFVKASQAKSRTTDAKSDWALEHRALATQAHALDRDVTTLLQALQANGHVPLAYLRECQDAQTISHQLEMEEGAAARETAARLRAAAQRLRRCGQRGVEADALLRELERASELEWRQVLLLEGDASAVQQEVRALSAAALRGAATLPLWWACASAQARAGAAASNTGGHLNAIPEESERSADGVSVAGESSSDPCKVSACSSSEGGAQASSAACKEAADDGGGEGADDDGDDAAMVAAEASVDASCIAPRALLASDACRRHVRAAVLQLHRNFARAVRDAALQQRRDEAPPGCSADELVTFVHARVHAASKLAQGAAQAAVLQECRKRLPAKSLAELRALETHWQSARAASAHTHALAAAWHRQHAALHGACAEELQHSHAERLARAGAAAEAAAAAAAAACSAAARHAAERDGRQLADRARLDARRGAAAQRAAECAAVEDAQARADAAWRALEAAEGLPRVQERRRVCELRAVEERRRATAERAAEAAREARLDRIRALVAVDVPADPERVLQPTASTLAAPAPRGAAFRAVHGYRADVVAADRRFRAAEALHARGLLARPAAKAALRELHEGAAPRRVDALTTQQRAAGGAPRFG